MDQGSRDAAVSGHSLSEAPVRRWSRAALLRRAGAGGLAVSLGGALLARRSGPAVSSPSVDARVLQFALIVERLQAAFYAEANKNGKLRGEVAEFSRVVGANEREHVAFVTKALRGSAAAAPRFSFGDATTSEKQFVRSAVELEDLGLAAYNGQATNLSPAALAAAAKIVSVEARHAAWIRDLAGKPPAPLAVDKPLDEAQVRAALKRTGYIKP